MLHICFGDFPVRLHTRISVSTTYRIMGIVRSLRAFAHCYAADDPSVDNGGFWSFKRDDVFHEVSRVA